MGGFIHFADHTRTIKVILTTGKVDIQIYVLSERCMKLSAHATSCRCQNSDLFFFFKAFRVALWPKHRGVFHRGVGVGARDASLAVRCRVGELVEL